MKSLRKKSVHSRKLTYLTAFTMVLALAGCSNTDDESPDLEETSDASVSDPVEYIPASEDGPAENVPEPRLPATATELSEDGAKASVRYFWKAEEYARLSGDTEFLKLISAETCEFCEESIEGWRASYDEGVWAALHDPLEIEMTDVLVGDPESENESIGYVFFELHEPATSFYDDNGERHDESFEKPDVTDWIASLKYDGTAQKWEIDWIGLEESSDWEE